MDSPLISVIVCSFNRPEMLRRALESVLLQDWRDYEVIVVDDGSDPPVELGPEYQHRVRLIRTEHEGVGAARAEGLNAARGDFTAYLDDDDTWKPDHLSTLYQYLIDNPDVDLVYADSEWVEEGGSPMLPYSIDFDQLLLNDANYIFAGDVMHRTASAREAGGFDASLRAYEDWDLWLRMAGSRMLRHLPIVLGMHYWHEGAVSAGEHWEEWERVYRQERDCPILGPSHAAIFDPVTWSDGHKELVWHSMFLPNHSFGYTARELLLALDRQGVDITLAPTRDQTPRELERFAKPVRGWNQLGFYYHYLRRPSALKCGRVITYSMWESTLVPEPQIKEINQSAELLYVPCRQNMESFKECGVQTRVKILHCGVDAEHFPYLSRNRQEYLTFGTFGSFSPRKGIDVLIGAFTDEFSHGESVRLLLKTTGPGEEYGTGDPRIEIVAGFASHEQLLELLRRMDVFVLPSRAEGFGLCGLEAMATALPVIATNWSGPVEYLDPAYSYPLSYRLVDAEGTEAHGSRFYGKWAEPDYDHLRYLMRRVYEHPEEAREKGRLASERVREDWTWDKMASQIIHDLDVVAQG